MPTFTSATSGTTGKPKTYTVTDEHIARRVAHMSDASRGVGFEACKSILVDFGARGYFGVVYPQYAVQRGIRCFHPTHGSTEATVEFIKREKIEGITSTPQGLYNYAKAIGGSYAFNWMLASTSRLTPMMSKTIREGMGHNLWSSYACAEAGIISIASANQIETMPQCVGKIVPDMEVRFENGEIVLRSHLLISGYDDPAHNTAFRDGWYYTGDLGHMEDDLLILDGRRQ